MKKGWVLLMMAGFLSACGNDAPIKITVDSTGKEKTERLWDSTKEGVKRVGEKAKELGEKAKDKLDNLTSRDSASKKH